MIELKFLKNDANILKCKNNALKIENVTLKNASYENVYLKNDNIILNKKLKKLSSNHENEIAKNKIEKSTTSHFTCHYCEKNGHILHMLYKKKILKMCETSVGA